MPPEHLLQVGGYGISQIYFSSIYTNMLVFIKGNYNNNFHKNSSMLVHHRAKQRRQLLNCSIRILLFWVEKIDLMNEWTWQKRNYKILSKYRNIPLFYWIQKLKASSIRHLPTRYIWALKHTKNLHNRYISIRLCQFIWIHTIVCPFRHSPRSGERKKQVKFSM